MKIHAMSDEFTTELHDQISDTCTIEIFVMIFLAGMHSIEGSVF